MNYTKNTHIIGIDLGDKSHETCTLNTESKIFERSSVLNNHEELIVLPNAREVGPFLGLVMDFDYSRFVI